MNGSSQYAMQVVKDKASAPDTPVKSGYRFVGWYNGNAKWNFDTPVTENLTPDGEMGENPHLSLRAAL